ncbi:unnamed protein product, partial [Heterosigma akashiwo]
MPQKYRYEDDDYHLRMQLCQIPILVPMLSPATAHLAFVRHLASRWDDGTQVLPAEGAPVVFHPVHAMR